MKNNSQYREGLFLVLYTILGITAFLLIDQIGFPEILKEYGNTAFIKLKNPQGAGFLGMQLFFLYSLLFLPAALLVTNWLARTQPINVSLLSAFAIASGTLRSLWWGVWISLFPAMAQNYSAGNATDQTTLSQLYHWFNEFLSTVSEDIGVNIFGGVWGIAISAQMITGSKSPSWLGYFGLSASLCYLFSTSEIFGFPEFPFVQLLAPLLTGFWFMAIGIYMVVTHRRVISLA